MLRRKVKYRKYRPISRYFEKPTSNTEPTWVNTDRYTKKTIPTCNTDTNPWLLHTQGGIVLHLGTKFEANTSIRSKIIRGPQILKFGHVAPATPTWGLFMVHTQEGPVLYLCTKFEADSLIHSKVIKGSQNFEIWSGDLGHAHLGVTLYSLRTKGPSSICIPNLKRIALFVLKL